VHLNIQQDGDLLLELCFATNVKANGELSTRIVLFKLERLLPLAIIATGQSVKEYNVKINQFFLSQESDEKRIESLRELFDSQAYWIPQDWVKSASIKWERNSPFNSEASSSKSEDSVSSKSSSESSSFPSTVRHAAYTKALCSDSRDASPVRK